MIDQARRMKDGRKRPTLKRGPQLRKILPPPGEDLPTSTTTVTLPNVLLERLSEIAQTSKKEDPKGKGYSRNGVIQQFLEWAVEAYDEDRSRRKK